MGKQAYPVEVRIPRGIRFEIHEAVLTPKAEKPLGELSPLLQRLELKDPEVERNLELYTPVVVLYEREDGRKVFYHSEVMHKSDEGEVFISFPIKIHLEKRKERLLINELGTLLVGNRSVPVLVADVTSDLSGAGIVSEQPLKLYPNDKVSLRFLFRGQQVELFGIVLWTNGDKKFGISGI